MQYVARMEPFGNTDLEVTALLDTWLHCVILYLTTTFKLQRDKDILFQF